MYVAIAVLISPDVNETVYVQPIASEGPGKLGSGPPDVAYNLVISQVSITLHPSFPSSRLNCKSYD
jgi:hypothetical protein